MMRERIGIRVDANEKIAMGHLMRCISVAQALRELGQEVIFIISEDYARELITKQGFACICLDNRYDQKEEETDCIVKLIKENEIHKLLLDSYEITEAYMRRLRACAKIIYIDDLNSFCYPVDLIINYTYGQTIADYADKGYKTEQLLLGSAYAPLRKSFDVERIRTKRNVERIFIATGGTDEYHMIVGILERMRQPEMPPFEKYVITGKFYGNTDALWQIAKEDASVKVFHDISNIDEIMRTCDIAVSAGGTTLAELCACGIPTVCFAIADNQLSGTKAFSENKLMLYAGDVRENRSEVIENIVKSVRDLAEDFTFREELGSRAKHAIDGHGAARIAQNIVGLK